MWEVVLSNIIQIVVAAVSTIVATVIVPKIAEWLKSKTENNHLQMIITDLTQTVQTSVSFVEQTIVKQLKHDGKWDKEGQAAALNAAIDEVINNLSNTTIDLLKKNSLNIEEIVTRYIEAQIQKESTVK